MTDRNTRLPGWHKLNPGARVARLAQWLGVSVKEVEAALQGGGLGPDQADRLVENVVGTYSLPFAVAANFTIDGEDRLIPMVTEEPSVVAAASNAARMAREGGGFRTEVDDPRMIGQIQVHARDLDRARQAIESAEERLLSAAAEGDPELVRQGGGPVGLEVRTVGDDGFLVVHLVVDVRDAMGANAVNAMSEAVAPILEELTGGRTGLCILSNLADRRLVRVEVDIPARALAMEDFPGDAVLDGLVSASRFAEVDPYRAATHNKGIMNGVDAVLLATGNDFRAVEAGAHAWAGRSRGYGPLCVWTRTETGSLAGRLELPMAVGLVGGATRVHPAARLALDLLDARTSADLATAAATAGMASNLAALRALSTEGIMKGHMRLHARSRDLVR